MPEDPKEIAEDVSLSRDIEDRLVELAKMLLEVDGSCSKLYSFLLKEQENEKLGIDLEDLTKYRGIIFGIKCACFDKTLDIYKKLGEDSRVNTFMKEVMPQYEDADPKQEYLRKKDKLNR